jgi:hypothetical protein
MSEYSFTEGGDVAVSHPIVIAVGARRVDDHIGLNEILALWSLKEESKGMVLTRAPNEIAFPDPIATDRDDLGPFMNAPL